MSETKHFRISMDPALPCRLSFKISLLGEAMPRQCVMNIPCPGDLTQRPTKCPLGVLEAVTTDSLINECIEAATVGEGEELCLEKTTREIPAWKIENELALAYGWLPFPDPFSKENRYKYNKGPEWISWTREGWVRENLQDMFIDHKKYTHLEAALNDETST